MEFTHTYLCGCKKVFEHWGRGIRELREKDFWCDRKKMWQKELEEKEKEVRILQNNLKEHYNLESLL